MTIFEQIQNSPEGGTAGRDGRGIPSTGYFVGGHGDAVVFGAGGELPSDLEYRVNEWLRSCGAPYIGWWTDEETGKLYLDGSDWIETEFTASQLGRLRKEIAIWDIANRRELRFAYVEGEGVSPVPDGE